MRIGLLLSIGSLSVGVFLRNRRDVSRVCIGPKNVHADEDWYYAVSDPNVYCISWRAFGLISPNNMQMLSFLLGCNNGKTGKGGC